MLQNLTKTMKQTRIYLLIKLSTWQTRPASYIAIACELPASIVLHIQLDNT